MAMDNNTGFLQPNKYHRAGDKLPCLKGHVNIEGVEYEVAVWAPKPSGKAYYARFKLKDEEQQQQAPQQAQSDPGWKDSPAPVQRPVQPPVERKPSNLFKR